MQLIRSMAPVTDSQTFKLLHKRLQWRGRITLAWRILLVNLLPVALLAASLFYLHSVRNRLLSERLDQAVSETAVVASTIATLDPIERNEALDRLGNVTGTRFRIFAGHKLIMDSWSDAPQSHDVWRDDPSRWNRTAAAWLDDLVDTVVGASDIPPYNRNAQEPLAPAELSLRTDRTHVITARAPIIGQPGTILVTDRHIRDVRRLVRAERARLSTIVAISVLSSILLSFFLARTIAQPLGMLATAAEKVRLGRARDIAIPVLDRRDEIGALSGALADMTENLRDRIDATEAFAADVAHELRNPLASLSSALETMGTVKQADLKAQLMAIAMEDVRRLDRLITDIAEASQLEPQLTRARFDRIDLGQLLETLIKDREMRGINGTVKIAFARPKKGSAMLLGEAHRLSRAFENLIDNAVSFSPPSGVVQISATRSGRYLRASIEDQGPGVAPSQREAIFERFHSDRPDIAAFGKHSGLGLPIARTIIEAHGGQLQVEDRPAGQTGALFTVTLPAAPDQRA
jgi:two-component system sensor histidine kinase ChvG